MARHWSYSEEKLRGDVLRAANWQCQIRGPGCLGTANEVDHVHPKAWGGKATRDNLRAACRPCNRSKGSRTDERFFSGTGHSRGRLRKVPPQGAPKAPKVRKIKVWAPIARDYSKKAEE